MLQGAFTSLDRIFGILDKKEFIEGDKAVHIEKANIRFENLNFRYNQSDSSSPLILDNISFQLPQGKSLALVGATGSGKSTIIKLISKLYDGYEGDIYIDDQNLKNLAAEGLRQSIAIVPQDIILFEGSILFNITLGHPHIHRDKAIKAANIVGLDDFVAKLPNNYDYEIKEGGANLSVGQRQLIAFARALAKDPKILILDEATSSVDPKSEMLIQNAIDRMLAGRTVIVIAHRLSTIKRCDKILVLEKGKIMERGDHKTLLEKKEKYFRLYTSMIEEKKTIEC
jgi:ATP-binding cassette subfamily B protein